MNNRQKRLCRAILDFYDASGAQPYPLALLAKKTGCHASDIYDKDSQSGDLWPFDPRARGNHAGMLSFAPGKNPTVSITAAGLVALENLCKEDPIVAPREKASSTHSIIPPPKIEEEVIEPDKAAPAPTPPFSAAKIADARARFKDWLKSEQARSTLLDRHTDDELVEAALDKFFSEFLVSKEP